MTNIREIRVDRNSFSVTSLKETDEKSIWRSKTPLQRLEELELNRKIVFGYDTAPRLQRLLEVTKSS